MMAGYKCDDRGFCKCARHYADGDQRELKAKKRSCQLVCERLHDDAETKCECFDDDFAGPRCEYKICNFRDGKRTRLACIRNEKDADVGGGGGGIPKVDDDCAAIVNRRRTNRTYDDCRCFNDGKMMFDGGYGGCECPSGFDGVLCEKKKIGRVVRHADQKRPPNQPRRPRAVQYKSPTKSDDGGLSGGAIFGIVFCVLLLLVGIGVAVYFFVFRRRKDEQQQQQPRVKQQEFQKPSETQEVPPRYGPTPPQPMQPSYGQQPQWTPSPAYPPSSYQPSPYPQQQPPQQQPPWYSGPPNQHDRTSIGSSGSGGSGGGGSGFHDSEQQASQLKTALSTRSKSSASRGDDDGGGSKSNLSGDRSTSIKPFPDPYPSQVPPSAPKSVKMQSNRRENGQFVEWGQLLKMKEEE